ncbi:MbnP family copper-binding protein [Aliiglaciecola lipolytica]|uniref:MbnP family copper-binding protein n=1 Tax=Aliiglaciecola lipolytica TaxID=477689 RepID=UPI001C090090|nr:MbnP family copper-binding protein [Aliiglaciecola lipolytica]MBU2878431.1 metallo-mystery pair system four-Cys motif protein [Aliiglaciecola lipolytica]
MQMNARFISTSIAGLFGLSVLTGCGGSSSSDDTLVAPVATAFKLNFKAMSGSEEINCDTMLTGYGSDQSYSVGLSDLRFYVSNIKFYDQYDVEIEITLDENEFQYQNAEGFVGLVDMTSNSSGSCQSDAIAFSEGTARTNTSITGTLFDTGVTKVTFDVGVPQGVMKDVIATNSAEDAPSPLNEMYWSWADGYRHFVMNFAIEDTNGIAGEGYLHIGSRGCGGDGLLALEGKDECDFVNTPKVELIDFDPAVNTVVIDVQKVLNDVAFASTNGTDAPAVSCHSAPSSTQVDCGPIFVNFGIDGDTGEATASSNLTVSME